MDHQVAVRGIPVDYRGNDRNHILVETGVVGADLIAGAAGFRRVKVFDLIRGGRIPV